MELFNSFYGMIGRAIEAKGVYPHYMLVENKDGYFEMYCLDLSPCQVLSFVLKTFRAGSRQLVYGLDRICLPGQGTTLKDCIAGCHLVDGAWKPFVIEYQHEPRIVKPASWENEFWIKVLRHELKQASIG